MRALVRSIVCTAILISAQPLVLAQGAMVGYSTSNSKRVYRIDLTNPGATIELGLANECQDIVSQNIGGMFSVDGLTGSRLFGVSRPFDEFSTCPVPSALADLTAAACSPAGSGVLVGETGVVGPAGGVGGAYDFINGTAYASFVDEFRIVQQGTALYSIDISTGNATLLSATRGVYLDGLAFGGDGVLYASDPLFTRALYHYNFDLGQFEIIAPFDVPNTARSGLANYRGPGGTGTNLYMITDRIGSERGRLWSVSTSGAATLIGNIGLPGDIEGFDIPWSPLACN